MNSSPPPPAGAAPAPDPSPARPRRKPGTRRVPEIEAELRRSIASGRYAVGQRLPTEPELTREYNVSRTVLREAVSALRSEGLLQSRQGAGVFVLRDRPESSRLSFLTDANATISDVIEELELRSAVEIEAAGLACQRASPAQIADIQTRHRAFVEAVRAGDPTEEADAQFHRAIARATNNARFEAFLVHMGERTIPRAKLRLTLGDSFVPASDSHLGIEHQAIVVALAARDAGAARDAMRAHLGGSVKRYGALLDLPAP